MAKNTNWATKVGVAFNKTFLTGDRVTGEFVRLALKRSVRTKPTHMNAWGSLIGNYVQRGILIDTGKTRAMRDPRSHGRRTPVYIVG